MLHGHGQTNMDTDMGWLTDTKRDMDRRTDRDMGTDTDMGRDMNADTNMDIDIYMDTLTSTLAMDMNICRT
jgi:hypothetical protein